MGWILVPNVVILVLAIPIAMFSLFPSIIRRGLADAKRLSELCSTKSPLRRRIEELESLGFTPIVAYWEKAPLFIRIWYVGLTSPNHGCFAYVAKTVGRVRFTFMSQFDNGALVLTRGLSSASPIDADTLIEQVANAPPTVTLNHHKKAVERFQNRGYALSNDFSPEALIALERAYAGNTHSVKRSRRHGVLLLVQMAIALGLTTYLALRCEPPPAPAPAVEVRNPLET